MAPIELPVADASGFYFFLSYAHQQSPTDAGPPVDVSTVFDVFRDLYKTVRGLCRPGTKLSIGFVDQLVPPGPDRVTMTNRALATAEVFVPLCSDDYLHGTNSTHERASYLLRLAAAAPEQVRRHMLPVLWMPMRDGGGDGDLAAALSFGADIPHYAEHGLLGLRRLTNLRPSYDRLLLRVARWIVDVAETSPLDSAAAVDDEPTRAQVPFVVAVIAPSTDDLPQGRKADGYGERPSQWQPFAYAQPLPVADHAARAASRLALPSRVVDFATDPDVFDVNPGLILIDPWIIETPDGRTRLEDTIDRLHPWVSSVAVANLHHPQHDERGARLTQAVAHMFYAPRQIRFRRVEHVDQFVEAMQLAITDSRRQYLRSDNVRPPAGPHFGRPRLGGDPRPPHA